MRNLTLAIEDELLTAARRVALESNTTVNQMVREFLSERVRERDLRSTARAALERSFDEIQIQVGTPSWTRDELHER
ncbi:MAG: hypothetical protein KDD11_17270 [Acidobacteria bacterium]|nr:hypothetical protein [Acidobacteriota bacterium]